MRISGASLLLALLAATPPVAVHAEGSVLDGNYAYHTRAGDTLIGLGMKLLREPGRWHDLQVMNRVARPRQMPKDTVLLIPYPWLKLTAEAAEAIVVGGEARANGQPLRPGARLAEGTVVETGASGSVTLAMPDGSTLTLQKDSHLALDRLERIDGLGAHDMSFRLTAGRVETKVAPQRDVGRFEIRTPVAVTAVRGTRFRATYDTQDSDARTETLDGVVGVSAQAAVVPVTAGYGTRVERGATPGSPVRLPLPPVLEGFLPPVNGAADLDVAYVPVAGAARYRTQLAQDATFYGILRDELAAEPRVHLADVADGDYYLRVRSITQAGLEGPDATYRVTERRAPPPPALTEPAGEASIPGRSARFAWRPEPGAVRYAFELARDPDFATLVAGSGDTTQPGRVVEDLDAATYYWRVRAINADGNAGAVSAPSRFHQRALAPQPGATLERGRARVSWPALPGERYEVEVARDEAFAYPAASALVSGGEWESGPLSCGDYWLRLRPRGEDGYRGAPGAPRRLHVPYPAWLKFAPLVLVLPFL